MELSTFRGELARGEIRPAYLFVGDQDLLKEDAVERLRALALPDGRGTVRKLQATDAKAEEILRELGNFSLLEPVAVVVVRQASRLAVAELEALQTGLRVDLRQKIPKAKRGPGDPPLLVFWDEDFDKRKALFSEIARAGAEVEFRMTNRREAASWVGDEAGRMGHRLAPGAAECLVEAVGTDLLRLHTTLGMLSVAVGPGKPIGEPTVARLVPEARPHALYELQDALAERKGALAVRLLRVALDEGERPELLLGVLFAQLRRLLSAREIPPGTDLGSAAQTLGAPPFKVKGLLENAHRFPDAHLRRALERLADTDVAVKTGHGDAPTLLEEWVVSFCGGGGAT